MAKKTEQVEITIKAPWLAGYRYSVVIEPVAEDQSPQIHVEGSAASAPPDYQATEDRALGFKR